MFKKLSLLLFGLIWAASSQAMPITWNLVDATFDDGAIVTGDLVFDEDAFLAHDYGNVVLDWNLSISGGDESTFPAFTYTPATAPAVGVFTTDTGYSFQFYVDPSALGGTPESRVIVLTSDAPLTNAGGTVPLYTNPADGVWQSRECYNCNPYRVLVAGSFTTVSVPEPTSFWLLASGLIGLIGVTRKKFQIV